MTLAGWPVDAAALAVTFGALGWLLGIVAVPQPLGALTRLWLALSLAVPATTLVALPGLFLQRLDLTSVVLATAGLGLAAGWRGRKSFAPSVPMPLLVRYWLELHRVRRALGRKGAPSLLRRRLPPAIPAVPPQVLLGIASVALVSWFVVLTPQLARGSSPWPSGLSLYYWSMAESVVSAHGLPASLAEWGALRPFPVEYLVATIHGSVTAIVAGDTGLGLQDHYRLTLLLLTVVAAFALFRAWLPAWWAFLAASLSVSGVYLSSKLLSYRPETFGFLLVLWSAWLFDEALQRRSVRWTVLAGIVVATSFLAHGSAWLVAGPLWLGILVGRTARLPAVRSSVATRLRGVASAVRPRAPLGLLAVGGTAFVLTVVGITAGSGTADRLIPLLTGDKSAEVATTEVATASSDPTWDFYYLATYQPVGAPTSPPDLCGNLLRSRIVREPWAGVDVLSPLFQAGLVLVVLLLALAPFPSSALRRILLGAGVFSLGLYVVTEALCHVYHTFVPARAGPSRVLPYYVIAAAVLLALCGWGATWGFRLFAERRAKAGRGGLLTRSVTPVSIGMTAILSGILIIAFSPVGGATGEESSGRLSDVTGEAYLWMRDNLPTDAIVMTNAYTAGSLGAVSERTGLLDGRAPYLESPSWLAEASGWLRIARNYFADPASYRQDLPARVDYILVAKPGVDMGGRSFVTNYRALRNEPGLRLTRNFRQSAILLFEVTDDDPAGRGSAAAETSGALLR